MSINRLMRALAGAAVAVAVASCRNDVAAPSTITSQLRISANVSGTPINTVVLTVSATDILEPLVFNITAANGVASGTVDVPPGHARTFAAQGFDATGVVTHEGSVTIDVARGSNPPVALTMRPKSGEVLVTITVGSVGLTVAPASLTLFAGAQTATLTAKPVDETGAPIAGAIVGWASTNPAIATVNSAGVVTPLTVGSAEIVATYGGVASTCALTVSNTGNVILFERVSPTGGIFSVNSDGTNEHQIGLVADEGPAWSPDRRRIAFFRFFTVGVDGGIWTMNPDGTSRVRLTTSSNDHFPSWSPDGSHIAFESVSSLIVMTADGAHSAVLANDADLLSSPSWSPDGSRLAYGSNGNVMIINADATGERTLTAGSYPAWSPDGTEILYLHSGLNAIQLDGSLQRQITLGQDDRHPAWSPDGQSIVFSRNSATGQTINVTDRNGNNLRVISSGTTDVNPNWR